MTWAEFHSESEGWATEAQLALSRRDYEAAQELYNKAAASEQRALDQLGPEKVRTRGVTAVSAVALWYKAGQYLVAEQLAHRMLSDGGIPAFAREGLRNLVQAIWTELSKQTANVSFMPGQVTVSVKGGDVVTGGAPLDIILEKVNTIQAMFFRTIEYLSGFAHRRFGGPDKYLREACRPWLFQSPPGSYQFTVVIQQPSQADFFQPDIEPAEIAHRFLEIVGAASSEDSAELIRLVPDKRYRTTFLKLARNLAPAGSSYERLEFRAPSESKHVAISQESRSHISRRLREESADSGIGEVVQQEFRGVLRAVHLDKDWLEIVVDGTPRHVKGLEDTVDDVIGPMVNRNVLVRAVHSPKKRALRFIDIEMVE